MPGTATKPESHKQSWGVTTHVIQTGCPEPRKGKQVPQAWRAGGYLSGRKWAEPLICTWNKSSKFHSRLLDHWLWRTLIVLWQCPLIPNALSRLTHNWKERKKKEQVPDLQESMTSIYNRMPQVNGMDKQDRAAAVCLKCEKKLKASPPHCSSSN